MSDSKKLLMWQEGEIDEVDTMSLPRREDERGWLTELYRNDDMHVPGFDGTYPVMGYVSLTKPGVMRGPHEHEHQQDLFVFNGPFEVFLWDARERSATFGYKQKILTPSADYFRVAVPPGVVHGYRNTTSEPALVFNFPNRLYQGWDRLKPVDEIRHEDEEATQYAPW